MHSNRHTGVNVRKLMFICVYDAFGAHGTSGGPSFFSGPQFSCSLAEDGPSLGFLIHGNRLKKRDHVPESSLLMMALIIDRALRAQWLCRGRLAPGAF